MDVTSEFPSEVLVSNEPESEKRPTKKRRKSSRSETPLTVRATTPWHYDGEKLFADLEHVFRQEEETDGAVCTAVEMRADPLFTRCVIQVEIHRGNAHVSALADFLNSLCTGIKEAGPPTTDDFSHTVNGLPFPTLVFNGDVSYQRTTANT
ncbi:hypothetical protein Bbelb_199350 [Branchiostoma belcheri]|nr:hypothetical protein Bbelb_199350 [Branchiostoma belcheri]